MPWNFWVLPPFNVKWSLSFRSIWHVSNYEIQQETHMSWCLCSSKSTHTSCTKAQEESQPGKQVSTPGSLVLRRFRASKGLRQQQNTLWYLSLPFLVLQECVRLSCVCSRFSLDTFLTFADCSLLVPEVGRTGTLCVHFDLWIPGVPDWFSFFSPLVF